MTDDKNGDAVASAENPAVFTGLKLGHIKDRAAGIPAVLTSFQQVFGQAGVLRGLKALGQLNQKTGFDCPGCAWLILMTTAAALRNIVRMARRQLRKKPPRNC